jgi:hypothetical protein
MNEYDFGLSNAAEGVERYATGKASSLSEGMRQVKEQEEINNRTHPLWASLGTMGGVGLGSAMGPAKTYVDAMSKLAPEVQGLVRKGINYGTQAAGYETAQNIGQEGKLGNPTFPFLFGGATGVGGEKVADFLDRTIGTAAERLSPRAGQLYRDLGGADPAVESAKVQADPRSSPVIKTAAQKSGYDLKNPVDVAALKSKLATPGTTLADVFDPGSVRPVFNAAVATPKGASAVRAARESYATRAAAPPPTPPPPTAPALKPGLFTTVKGNKPKFLDMDTATHDLMDTDTARALVQPIRDRATQAFNEARVYGDPPKWMPHHQSDDDPHTIDQIDQLRQALQDRATSLTGKPGAAAAQTSADLFANQAKIDIPGYDKYLDALDTDKANVAATTAQGNVLDTLRGSPIPTSLTPPPKPEISLNAFDLAKVGRSLVNAGMAGSQARAAAAAVPVLTSQDLGVTMKAIDALAPKEPVAATALAQKVATQAALDVTAVQNQPPNNNGVSVVSARPATPEELAQPRAYP